jgi:protoheme IX farnesyltransferase
MTALVLATPPAGFWQGLRPAPAVARQIPLLVGTGLVVGGANALNQWMERDLDGLMQRTKDRPLPSGRLRPETARRFGVALVALGVVLLAAVVNGLTAALALLSAASYLFLYTPMKRWTPLCTLIGAIPGALPPLIGWVGARGQLGLESWVLFTILFVWQLPHFLAIAWLYRDDYARAAFRFLPVLDPSGMSTSRQLLWYATALLAVSLFPTIVGLAGSRYFVGALVLGCAFLWVSLLAALGRTAASARRLFLSSVSYLPLLLSLMVADKLPA